MRFVAGEVEPVRPSDAGAEVPGQGHRPFGQRGLPSLGQRRRSRGGRAMRAERRTPLAESVDGVGDPGPPAPCRQVTTHADVVEWPLRVRRGRGAPTTSTPSSERPLKCTATGTCCRRSSSVPVRFFARIAVIRRRCRRRGGAGCWGLDPESPLVLGLIAWRMLSRFCMSTNQRTSKPSRRQVQSEASTERPA